MTIGREEFVGVKRIGGLFVQVSWGLLPDPAAVLIAVLEPLAQWLV